MWDGTGTTVNALPRGLVVVGQGFAIVVFQLASASIAVIASTF
jgi:hypothetical protein